MPAYPGEGQATLIYENQQKFFWLGETVATGTASVAFQLRRERGSSYPWGCAIEVSFAGAPGAFEIDVQGADSEIDGAYVEIASITSVNASNFGRVDIAQQTPFFGKFIRLYMKTLTNSVAVTAKLTR